MTPAAVPWLICIAIWGTLVAFIAYGVARFLFEIVRARL